MRNLVKAYVVGIAAALAVLFGYAIAQTGGGFPPSTVHMKKGSFTITAGSCTTSPTGTAQYTQVWQGSSATPPLTGYAAFIQLPFISCTATGSPTATTWTGFPANINTLTTVKMSVMLENAGASVPGTCQLNGTALQCATQTGATMTGVVALGDTTTSANNSYLVVQ